MFYRFYIYIYIYYNPPFITRSEAMRQQQQHSTRWCGDIYELCIDCCQPRKTSETCNTYMVASLKKITDVSPTIAGSFKEPPHPELWAFELITVTMKLPVGTTTGHIHCNCAAGLEPGHDDKLGPSFEKQTSMNIYIYI